MPARSDIIVISNPLENRRIGIIGAGEMGSALCRGMVESGEVNPKQILVTDPVNDKPRRLESSLGVQSVTTNAGLVKESDLILLAVKPHLAVPVLQKLGSWPDTGKLLISIAAGISSHRLEDAVKPYEVPVIRAMPNTPAQVRAGACAISRGRYAQDEHAELARAIFETVGVAVEVEERLMDAVTGLSGSGPAYVFLVIEALTDGGVKAGLPRDVSLKLAAQTVLGAARMVIELNLHPAALKDRVTTPGGTTITGLSVLEEAGARSAFIKAVEAGTRRSSELG